MNHDATHCTDFCSDCPMKCYRAELEVDLRSRWKEFVGVPLSYAHLYDTEECKRDSYHKESEAEGGELYRCDCQDDVNDFVWNAHYCMNCGAYMGGEKE